MASVQEKANVTSGRLVPRPEGLACVLAIGTAFPRASQSQILIHVLVQTVQFFVEHVLLSLTRLAQL
jgi:hypothetical protein